MHLAYAFIKSDLQKEQSNNRADNNRNTQCQVYWTTRLKTSWRKEGIQRCVFYVFYATTTMQFADVQNNFPDIICTPNASERRKPMLN